MKAVGLFGFPHHQISLFGHAVGITYHAARGGRALPATLLLPLPPEVSLGPTRAGEQKEAAGARI